MQHGHIWLIQRACIFRNGTKSNGCKWVQTFNRAGISIFFMVNGQSVDTLMKSRLRSILFSRNNLKVQSSDTKAPLVANCLALAIVGRCTMWMSNSNAAWGWIIKCKVLSQMVTVYKNIEWKLKKFTMLNFVWSKISNLTTFRPMTHKVLIYWGRWIGILLNDFVSKEIWMSLTEIQTRGHLRLFGLLSLANRERRTISRSSRFIISAKETSGNINTTSVIVWFPGNGLGPYNCPLLTGKVNLSITAQITIITRIRKWSKPIGL